MRDELITQDWDIVKRMLPEDWQASARECGALRRARNVDSAETLLRLILLHTAGGLSLRQTVARAATFGWAELSDVALLNPSSSVRNDFCRVFESAWAICWGIWAKGVWRGV